MNYFIKIKYGKLYCKINLIYCTTLYNIAVLNFIILTSCY